MRDFYNSNSDFRDYVEKYRRKHELSVDEALQHAQVREAAKYYREKDGKPEGVPFELADIVIRCFDMADAFGIDLEAAILEKHEFNKTRPYLHGKKF